MFSLLAVLVLAAVAFFGAQTSAGPKFFGIWVPYAALALFVAGFIRRVLKWGGSAVPFRIPTTSGQQKSLPWIKHASIENPSDVRGVLARMFLEVFFFRSLFSNIKLDSAEGPRLAYGSTRWLWMAGLAFHWSFLVVAVRHLRFFMAKVPGAIRTLEALDSFLQIGVPLLYMTDLVLIGAVTFLFLRRVFIPQVKYISLAADYFPLFLILGIAISGMLMRYLVRVDVVGVKTLTMGLVGLNPTVPEGIHTIFFMHLFLISTLFAYIPFSKLMHMGGVFMSPTRNLANDSRMRRHVNPWDYPVKVHTYEEYEEEFREKMKSVNLPVQKE